MLIKVICAELKCHINSRLAYWQCSVVWCRWCCLVCIGFSHSSWQWFGYGERVNYCHICYWSGLGNVAFLWSCTRMVTPTDPVPCVNRVIYQIYGFLPCATGSSYFFLKKSSSQSTFKMWIFAYYLIWSILRIAKLSPMIISND